MADAGRISIYHAAEASLGAAVSAGPMLTLANCTALSPKTNTGTEQPAVYRGNYTKATPFRKSSEGSVEFDGLIYYGALEALAKAVMRSAGMSATINSTGTDVSITVAGSVMKFHRVSGSFVTDGWVVGQVGRSAGFAAAANNSDWIIDAVTATDLTVVGPTLIAVAAGPAITLSNKGMLRTGTTLASETLEHNLGDMTNEWHRTVGCRPTGLQLDVAVGAQASAKWMFTAKTPLARYTASAGNGTLTAPAANYPNIYTGDDDATGVMVNNVLTTSIIEKLGLNFQAPVRPIRGLGGHGRASAIGGNSFALDLTLGMYFDADAADLYDLRLDFDANGPTDDNVVSFWYKLVNADGTYSFRIPRGFFVSGDPTPSGPDTDINLELGLMADYDPVTGCLWQIDKLE